MEGSVRTRQKRRFRDCGVVRIYGTLLEGGTCIFSGTGLPTCIPCAGTNGC